ncbi:MAG TPA: molybdopterin-guanine dinucleotide biosynthesis protein MobB [Acidiferrobacterales bacterium]|nr:molybdopterin-guanine dinucleotide biosynthesis protein MobB [Acidiferrobacterales bacterium]
MLKNARLPILGFAAFSGTGKTTLLIKLLPLLTQRGLRIGMIKHAHHSFDVDTPGKDSYELRQAGAAQMLIASRRRWALMVETKRHEEPALDELLAALQQDSLDLILVEGFKQTHFPKIELHRPSLGHRLMYAGDPSIIAVATDTPLRDPPPLPLLDLNRPEQVADFIVERFIKSTRLRTG